MADIVMRSELALFDPAPLDCCIEKQTFVDYRPDSSIDDNTATITFNIPSTEMDYIDLSATTLSMKVQLADVGNTGGVDPAKVLIAPSNLLIASAFQDVQLFLNNTLAEGGNFLYPYKSYLCALLEHGTNSHKQVMRTWGFYQENGDLAVDVSNSGFAFRVGNLSKNKSWTVRGPLFLDMMRQSRFLIPKVSVRLVFHLSPARWLLMQAKATDSTKSLPAAPRLKIISAQLTVRHVTPIEGVRNAHEAGLKANHPALYPLRMIIPFTHTIPSGGQYHNIENVFQSVVPSLLVMAFVKDSAFNGSYTENPLKFMNPELTSLGVFVNGYSVPSQPLKFPDGKLGDNEYCWLLQQLGIGWSGIHEIGFDAELYPFGYSLFAFSLNAALGSAGSAAQIPRSGNLRVELRFNRALESALTLITFGIFDRQLSIFDGGEIIPGNINNLRKRKLSD
jgi:hypothetical protein